jgi:outer membrane lipoprotein
MLTLLVGCATPLPFVGAPAGPTAWEVAEDIERHIDREVLWGGMILEVEHHPRYTELEMLAFPLDHRQRPQPRVADEGRFILIVAGFVDPAVYAPGRFITFPGRITGARRGELRGAAHVWPMLDSLQLYLWPKDFSEEQARFSIGVGVRL